MADWALNIPCDTSTYGNAYFSGRFHDEKIIQAIKEHQITDKLIDNICKHASDTMTIVPASIPPISTPPASVNTTPSETLSKKDEKLRKKARLKANQKLKN